MDKRLIAAIVVLVAILVLAWSPWITKDYAEKRTVDYFEKINTKVMDGCGFNCEGCGIYWARKTLFGVKVTVLYDCGFHPPREVPGYVGEYFVSAIGTIHRTGGRDNRALSTLYPRKD